MKINLLLFCSLIAFASCSKQADLENNKQRASASTQVADDGSIIVTAKIISTNPLKLESDSILEKAAVNKETGEITYGYVYKYGVNDPNAKLPSPMDRGYYLVGACFRYGTMYHGDNGVDLFVPCGMSCVGFNDICPPDGDGYVRQAQTLTLKFSRY